MKFAVSAAAFVVASTFSVASLPGTSAAKTILYLNNFEVLNPGVEMHGRNSSCQLRSLARSFLSLSGTSVMASDYFQPAHYLSFSTLPDYGW